MNNNNPIPEDLFNALAKDKSVRRKVMKDSFNYFFHFYFNHYVQFETAPFQHNLIGKLENEPDENLFVVAFRGSGKSTIATTAYPIWAILGKQEKKFVIIFCQTRTQAKQHMMNIRNELENNPLLKSDLGPFNEESDEWGSHSLVFSNTHARITVASTEQSIRGLRHHQHRPDLFICDDVEDVSSTKTREGRNKTYQWLTSDVIPAGDQDTRLIVVGNLLHEDSLLMRLRERVERNELDGTFMSCAIVNSKGKSNWYGKYPDQIAIDKERKKVGDEIAWQREYLLNIVPDEDQAIHLDWIQYYDELPEPSKLESGYASHTEVRFGIDLAISKRDTADYTAIVPALLYELYDGFCVYILPKVINKRLTFPETVETCLMLDKSYRAKDRNPPTFVIEDVAYQKALPQQLINEGLWNVVTVRPGHQDKRTRLVLTANFIKTGKVLFPREGAEELIQQIVHFGVEKHDDLADAFSNVILHSIENPPYTPRIYCLG